MKIPKLKYISFASNKLQAIFKQKQIFIYMSYLDLQLSICLNGYLIAFKVYKVNDLH